MVTAMVAISLLRKHPGSAICYNLICSRSVPETIEEHGGRPIRTPVGHSLIKKIMREEDAIFGGEHSGHFYFRENWYADSGLIAALTVLQLISEEGKPVSEVIGPIDTRVPLRRDQHPRRRRQERRGRRRKRYSAEGATIDHLDGVTIGFPDWWFNLRASNTEPLLRLNVEAETPELLATKTAEVRSMIPSS